MLTTWQIMLSQDTLLQSQKQSNSSTFKIYFFCVLPAFEILVYFMEQQQVLKRHHTRYPFGSRYFVSCSCVLIINTFCTWKIKSGKGRSLPLNRSKQNILFIVNEATLCGPETLIFMTQ